MNVPDDRAIGGRLREARADARLTQADTAAALGIPRSAVSALETGERHLTAVELAKCAVLFRRPASWFLGQDEDGGPSRLQPGLGALVAALPGGARDTVTSFAEFLATQSAAGSASAPPREDGQDRPAGPDGLDGCGE